MGVAKLIVFSLEYPGVGASIAHLAHLGSIWWASLYAIRCRQIAIDCYIAADALPLSPGIVPGSSIIGRPDRDGPVVACKPQESKHTDTHALHEGVNEQTGWLCCRPWRLLLT